MFQFWAIKDKNLDTKLREMYAYNNDLNEVKSNFYKQYPNGEFVIIY